MFSRRKFLATAAASGIALHIGSAASSEPLRIGLVADAQYADVPATDPKIGRHYQASIQKLTDAVNHFNGKPLDFCVHVGDLIDRDWKSFDPIQAVLAKSKHKFHHVLGNHDYNVWDPKKAEVPGKMGMPARYYFFDQKGFRFIFLDTNEVSTFAYPKGSPEAAAGQAELKRIKDLGLKQAVAWNSGIGADQLAWFEKLCAEAAAKKIPVIVFAHNPVCPEGGLNLWNCDEVLQAIGRHKCVVAWFNGHNHHGKFAELEGVPYLTLRGMVETSDTAFSVMEVTPSAYRLEGFGREPSREQTLKAVG